MFCGTDLTFIGCSDPHMEKPQRVDIGEIEEAKSRNRTELEKLKLSKIDTEHITQ